MEQYEPDSSPGELQSSDSLESLFQIITTVTRRCEDGGGGNGGSLSVSPDNTGYPSCLKRKSSEHTKATKRKARTCFSAHISTVISTSSTNSGWWTPAELKVFRDRVWQDATLSTHLRRKRANSVEAEYAYDDCCNGDDDLWLEEGASAPQSNPQQPPNPQRFRPSPSHPPFLELTSEAEKSVGTLKVSPPLTVKVNFVLIASQEPAIFLLLTKHILSLYPSIPRSNIFVISKLSQKLGRDIPFDVVFVESSFENSHLIGAYYRHSHPRALVVGLDRPMSSCRLPDKLCHMMWSLPPPRSDDTLKARLDNAFSFVRRDGAADV
ncbi:hypothetical protein TrRE_jg6835 [Triparma retinervis]|uniref:Uncharacterized protein n=1 Tax=Triparma retinervis TaxID=2557542 RepID=A0A9W7A5V3_9STRA|nr:hypothetical protein TrRE_jg6835 [Triparma retinervis]